MEATLTSPSPATAESTDKPQWLKWKERVLDGKQPERLTHGYTEHTFSYRISGKPSVGPTFSHCCGSRVIDCAKGTTGKNPVVSNLGVFNKGLNDGGFANRLGLYILLNADKDKALALFQGPGAETFEMQEGEDVHTVIWRPVYE